LLESRGKPGGEPRKCAENFAPWIAVIPPWHARGLAFVSLQSELEKWHNVNTTHGFLLCKTKIYCIISAMWSPHGLSSGDIACYLSGIHSFIPSSRYLKNLSVCTSISW
jgi:hypothetical protein